MKSASLCLMILATAGCAARRVILVEGKGSSLYLQKATASEADEVVGKTNERLRNFDVRPHVLAAASDAGIDPHLLDFYRGAKGPDAETILAGEISLWGDWESVASQKPSMPPGKSMHGEIAVQAAPWPRKSHFLPHPDVVLAQVQVTCTLDPVDPARQTAFIKGLVARCLAAVEETVREAAGASHLKVERRQ
jgi:hypothetical protein